MIDGIDSVLEKRILARNKKNNDATRINIIFLPDVQRQYHRQMYELTNSYNYYDHMLT